MRRESTVEPQPSPTTHQTADSRETAAGHAAATIYGNYRGEIDKGVERRTQKSRYAVLFTTVAASGAPPSYCSLAVVFGYKIPLSPTAEKGARARSDYFRYPLNTTIVTDFTDFTGIRLRH